MIAMHIYQDVNFTKVIATLSQQIVVHTQYLLQLQIMLHSVLTLKTHLINTVDMSVEVHVQHKVVVL